MFCGGTIFWYMNLNMNIHEMFVRVMNAWASGHRESSDISDIRMLLLFEATFKMFSLTLLR